MCPNCGRPYGKRRRCYWCTNSNPRRGETRTCAQCGQPFYAPLWAIRDTKRNGATFCSVACKHEAQRGSRVVGTRYGRPDGYVEVRVGVRKRVLEHRLVMEQMLGRPLERHEEVHHLNEDRADNRPENLELVTSTTHQQQYHGLRNMRRFKGRY